MASYLDNFNRTTLGANWSAIDGNWSIYSSTEVQQSAGGTHPAAVEYQGNQEDDQRTEIDHTYASATTYYIAPCVRMAKATDDFYMFVNRGNGLCRVYKQVGGTLTALGTDHADGVGATKTLKLEVEGTTLRAYVGGTSHHTVTDGTLSSGRPGIAAHSSGTQRGDNFVSVALGGGVVAPIDMRRVNMTGAAHR